MTTLPGGEGIPVLGQGTWNMAERRGRRADEIAALRMGVDLGMTVIDTAEMYGSGAVEELVAEALADRRQEIFLISKVLPQNATRRGTIAACEASLRRLKTDRLDVYLLHWRGSVPLLETLEAFRALKDQGKIRYWGVSNFDVDDMEEVTSLSATAGSPAATDQVFYNLRRRGIEFDLLPWCRAKGMPVMAYSPLDEGQLVSNRSLKSIARRLDVTAAQVALAWILRQEGIVAIPKSSNIERVRENRLALDLVLTEDDLVDLDKAFPPPTRKMPLETT
jgi:diketogulonate reductase-like aldo/keto reductase